MIASSGEAKIRGNKSLQHGKPFLHPSYSAAAFPLKKIILCGNNISNKVKRLVSVLSPQHILHGVHGIELEGLAAEKLLSKRSFVLTSPKVWSVSRVTTDLRNDFLAAM